MQPGTNLNSIFGTKEEGAEGKTAEGAETKEVVAETKASKEEAKETAPAKAEPKTEPVETKAKAEEESSEGSESKEVDQYADWTKEDFINEMKSARGEAAKNRIEKKEVVGQLEQEYERRLKELEAKFQPLAEKAKQLDKLKDQEADKKRSLEEKILHREEKIGKLQEQVEALEEKYREEKVALQTEAEKAKAEATAYQNFWTEQLEKELDDIPQKFKSTADLIVKGAGSVRDALDEIKKAKSENMFGNKTVKVFNATPNAQTGARLDEKKAQDERKAKMTSRDKIGEGLKAWRSKRNSR